MRPRAAAACGRTASFRQTERGRQQRPQRGRPGRRPAAPLLVTVPPPPTLPRAPGKLRAPISVERPGWGSGPGGGRSSRLHEADCSRGFWNLPATRGAHARGDQPAPRGRAGPQAAARTHLRTWQTVARAPGTEGRSRPQSGARRVRRNRSPAVARFQARGHGFAGASPRSPYPARVWAQQRSREGRSPWRSRRSCYYRGWAAGALRRLRLCPCRRKPTVPVTRDAPGCVGGRMGLARLPLALHA